MWYNIKDFMKNKINHKKTNFMPYKSPVFDLERVVGRGENFKREF